MRGSGLCIAFAIAAILGTPLPAQEGRWHRELPESYGIDFLAPLPALPAHLHSPWPSPPLARPPDQVRPLYVNAWAFGGSRFRELVRLADESEVNALVIDVKDDTASSPIPPRCPPRSPSAPTRNSGRETPRPGSARCWRTGST